MTWISILALRGAIPAVSTTEPSLTNSYYLEADDQIILMYL